VRRHEDACLEALRGLTTRDLPASVRAQHPDFRVETFTFLAVRFQLDLSVMWVYYDAPTKDAKFKPLLDHGAIFKAYKARIWFELCRPKSQNPLASRLWDEINAAGRPSRAAPPAAEPATPGRAAPSEGAKKKRSSHRKGKPG